MTVMVATPEAVRRGFIPVSYTHLMQIHAGYFGWTPTLTENDLVDFLKIEFGRVGADTHLTPREVIRDFMIAAGWLLHWLSLHAGVR